MQNDWSFWFVHKKKSFHKLKCRKKEIWFQSYRLAGCEMLSHSFHSIAHLHLIRFSWKDLFFFFSFHFKFYSVSIFNTTENRCIELHSPDGIHSCILRAIDPQEALAWFNALHSAIARSAQRALLDANRALSNIIGELKHIGWLSRRVGNEQVIYLAQKKRKKTLWLQSLVESESYKNWKNENETFSSICESIERERERVFLFGKWAQIFAYFNAFRTFFYAIQ